VRSFSRSLPPPSFPLHSSTTTRFRLFLILPRRPVLVADSLSAVLPLGLVGVFRYFWFLVRLFASWLYKPIPIPDEPSYLAKEDVTVRRGAFRLNSPALLTLFSQIICPTIDADSHFLTALRTWLVGEPFEVLIITTDAVVAPLQAFADEINKEDAAAHPGDALGRDGMGRVRVFGVEKANKRVQMVEGIRRTMTDIIVRFLRSSSPYSFSCLLTTVTFAGLRRR
jgi:hypothetical protein